jgi:hypothetical protein
MSYSKEGRRTTLIPSRLPPPVASAATSTVVRRSNLASYCFCSFFRSWETKHAFNGSRCDCVLPPTSYSTFSSSQPVDRRRDGDDPSDETTAERGKIKMCYADDPSVFFRSCFALFRSHFATNFGTIFVWKPWLYLRRHRHRRRKDVDRRLLQLHRPAFRMARSMERSPLVRRTISWVMWITIQPC